MGPDEVGGDTLPTTEAALDLARTYVYGTEPGRIPPVLFTAYEAATDHRDRARLAAALARCWAYAGEHRRAVPFASAAVRAAEKTGDAALVADALDAALATHWGPDELEVRVDLATQLSDAAVHVVDPDVRTTAHLWLLTVAAETLDMTEINRHLRALEVLGEESSRAQFFAASRRLAFDLMRGRADTVDALVAIAEGAAADFPDAYMVISAMVTYGAVQSGDRRAEVFERVRGGEALAVAEGLREVVAEIAWLYLGLGLEEDARRLANWFEPGSVRLLARNQSYLPILQLLLDVALRLDLEELIRAITPLLLPYAGRAVINSGAVGFHGVTDDPLSRACLRLGDLERAAALRERALATYQRIGARWWRERLEAEPSAVESRPSEGRTMTLRPGAAGVWFVGRDGDEAVLPARRGFEHLHVLLSSPAVEVEALALAGGAVVIEQAGLGEVADRQALAAYRERLRDIDAELDEADAWADAGRAEMLAGEREALLAELAADTGLGGRARVVGSSAERARTTVRKAISAAIEAIHAVDPVVARHLTARVRTGLRCVYEPDPDAPVEWHIT